MISPICRSRLMLSLLTIQFIIVDPPTSIVDAYIEFDIRLPITYLMQHVSSPYLVVLLSGLASVKSLTLSKNAFMVCIVFFLIIFIYLFKYCV